ncbi:MAG: deoxyribodipyrimidine photo-lyase [Gemmatimonadaceae bacterium]|nr:deoxyribodipyrimidine photo-lyase [Gemmatimonadaceae bacterium]
MTHPLDSSFVRDQLDLRTAPANDVRRQPEGEFVLYWMQSTHRFEENWALRRATLEADRLGKPLLVYQGLNPTYEHANDRIHAFIIGNAAHLAARAPSLGLTYRFNLRHRIADDARVVDRLAARAALVVTDAFPTAGVAERTARVAARVPVHVEAVDSHGIVPAAALPKEEWAARTIRPKLLKLRDLALEPVADRPPTVPMSAALKRAIDGDIPSLALDGLDLAAELARCDIDHEVPAVALAPGLAAARARLAAFLAEALPRYAERRSDPTDARGSSQLSPYLHFGQIAAAEVARAALASGAGEQVEKFLDELITWRELALNFCVRNPHFASLKGLPDWVRANLAAHEQDERPVQYTAEQLERGETDYPLWNAAQHELRATGAIHNVMRMYWGKCVIGWMPSAAEALRTLIHLNNKWGLDGRDPSSFGGIQWCFGKFDRPWAPKRPVYGSIRWMSLERAYAKFDAKGYEARHLPRRAPEQSSLF